MNWVCSVKSALFCYPAYEYTYKWTDSRQPNHSDKIIITKKKKDHLTYKHV